MNNYHTCICNFNFKKNYTQSVKKIFIIYIVFVQAFNYKCPLLYFQMLNLIKTKIAFKKLVCI